METDELRPALLGAALPEVAFEGWSWGALRAGARELKMTWEDVQRAFPDGPRDLMEYWGAANDEAMLAELATVDLAALRTRQRIALAIRIRLMHIAPHREAMRRALSFLALPQNAALAARLLYRTVDGIWYACGDRATDASFYSKRALLAGVYASTVLYWVDDRSEGFEDTWGFLERRLDDVMRIPRVTGKLRSALRALPNPTRLFRPPALR